MDMTTGNTISENPNLLFSECIRLAAIAERAAVEAIRNRQRVRRSLYRAAIAYQKLVQAHHAWFLDQAKSVGGIDALLESWFRPLALFGEDWHDLLRDISEGVSENQYLALGAGSFVRRRKVSSLVNRGESSPPIPTNPDASLPLVDRAILLDEQNRILREQLLAARSDANELRRIAARQERRIVELETTLNRIQRAAHRI